MRRSAPLCATFALAFSVHLLAADPLGTSFVYQGRLLDAGATVDAPADLRFSLWDSEVGGTQIGATVEIPSQPVSDGRFSAALDFGAAAFDGSARWLQVEVRTPAGVDPYVTLDPRQEVTATPYALQTRGIFVDDVGNVGIGTTTPARTLDVVGTIDAGGTIYTDAVRNENGVVTTYERSLQRYVVIATRNTEGTSVPLDMSIVDDICGDEDGCSLVIGVKDWMGGGAGRVASRGPYRFFYAPASGFWRLSNEDTEGQDGNGVVQHVITYLDDAYFTDGTYVGYSAQGDTPGFSLLNWTGYPLGSVMLILED